MALLVEGSDARIFDSVNDQSGNQMLNPHSLTPFPNAILFNWATVLSSLRNLAALDFQALHGREDGADCPSWMFTCGRVGNHGRDAFALMGGVAATTTDPTPCMPSSRPTPAIGPSTSRRARSGFRTSRPC